MPVINLPTIVKGNTFSLAIPLQVYIVQDDELVLVDYVPESGDNITVRLKGERRNYTYIPSTNANIAYIHLGGNELVGLYAVEVEIVKDDDSKLTSFRLSQLNIVESIDEISGTELIDNVEQGVIYLNPEIFVAGEGGRGIVSITLTGTSGLVDTYTITYTDNTTSTFTVTNGEDGRSEQSDWAQTDPSADDYIKNKPSLATVATSGSYDDLDDKPTIPTVPTNVSAFTNDAGYLTQHQSIKTVNGASMVGSGNVDLLTPNFCPIIEDTRSSAVAAITGDAPFSELVDGQRIFLHLNKRPANNSTLRLTLSDGSISADIPIYFYSLQAYTAISRFGTPNGAEGMYLHLIFEGSQWVALGFGDGNTNYGPVTQSTINTGTDQVQKTITPKLVHDNAYIVDVPYTSSITALKANKMYDFGTVSTALTIPSLDATNDLVRNALNFYALRFIAGADNLSITFPTGVIVDDEPTINTGDYVEIMINKYGSNFYASIKVWQAQQ